MTTTRRKKRPNILFILSDDQGAWALGCAGNTEIETPNLDRLAASGMRFDNFFCASPVCSPARATLMTGRIPSQHGVHDWLAAGNTSARHEPARNGKRIEYLRDQPGYTDILADAGYRCGLSGKWHLGDSHHPQKSFSFWSVHAKGGGPYYGAPMIRNGRVRKEKGYVTDTITDQALDWLESGKQDRRPFYLSVHYTAPHSPWSRENHPAPLFDRYHQNCPFNSVPDQLKPPDWVRGLSIPVGSAEQRRLFLSGYYAAVTAMDTNIGRLLAWLDANGQRRDTLVVFTSDNGMNMGHHGVFGKGNATDPLNMFEESVKVPFIASQPGRIRRGKVADILASQYDFMPTLLDYVGLAAPRGTRLPGQSLAGTLLGAEPAANRPVVVFDEYGPVRMIRTRTWKYIHRHPDGPHELYDLRADPGEQRNLVGTRKARSVETRMRARLTAWFDRYVDPARDGARLPVEGRGQTGACDEPGGATFIPARLPAPAKG